MIRHFLFYIVISSLIMTKIAAQTGTFVALDGSDNLYNVDIVNCTKKQITKCSGFSFKGTSLYSIAMEGKTLYISDDLGNLYSSTLTGNSLSGCKYLGIFKSKSILWGLTVGPGGIVYSVNTAGLIETYTPKTNVFANLGSLPSSCTSAGDLLFYKGVMYVSCKYNGSQALVQVNMKNPNLSTKYLDFTTGTIFGFASVTVPCKDNQAYAVGNKGDIYKVDMLTKTQDTKVQCNSLGISTIWDAASIAETESATPPLPPTITTPYDYCQGVAVAPLDANVLSVLDTLRWYTSNTSITAYKNPTPPVSSTKLGTFTWYVSSFDTSTGCESDRQVITVNIHPYPNKPLISPLIDTVCNASVATLASNASNGNQWYFDRAIITDSIQKTLGAKATGSYYDVVTNQWGCSTSSDTARIKVLSTNISYTSQDFCHIGLATATRTGDSVGGKFAATPVGLVIDPKSGTIDLEKSKTGNYTVSYTLNGGKFSCPFTTNVNVNDSTLSTTNAGICVGGTYTFNGTTYSAAGTYLAHLTNSKGCDSVATLILTLNQPTSSTTEITVCPASLPYLWNGNSYSTAGTYLVHLTNSVGCDSAATLILTVNQTLTSTINVTICPISLPYSWNANTYSAAGTYTVTLKNSVGCDSIATLVLNVTPTLTSSTSITICQVDLPYSWNGNIYTIAGTYTVHLTTSVGCDSVATLILNVNQPTVSTKSISVCSPSLPYSWNGNTYTTAGTYTAHLTNSVGCDSTATLILTVNQPTTSTTSLIVCSTALPFLWNGNSYTSAGTYIAHLNNNDGCDSAATLNLTVNQSSTSITTASICAGSTYSFNGTVYNTAGTYIAHLSNSVGCDSAATLELSVKASSSSTTKATICDKRSYTFNGVTYTTAGTYLAHLTNSVGCDSVANLILTVNKSTASSSNQEICEGNSYLFNGTSYNTTGTYIANLTNSVGCDSTATLVLTIAKKLNADLISGPTSVDIGQTIQLIKLTDNTPNGMWVSEYPSIATIDANSGLVTGVSSGVDSIFYIVSNACGPDSAKYKISVIPPYVYIPNAFNPKGSGGPNEVFYVRGDPMAKMELRIFDSWGNEIFMSKGQVEDPSKGWRGTFNGKAQPPGVYVYVARIEMSTGEIQIKKGAINLIR